MSLGNTSKLPCILLAESSVFLGGRGRGVYDFISSPQGLVFPCKHYPSVSATFFIHNNLPVG